MIRNDDNFKREMALRYLQYCGVEVEELSAEAWNCFKCIDVKIYTIPLIKRDYENGTDISMLGKRYRMSYYQIKKRLSTNYWIGARNGIDYE